LEPFEFESKVKANMTIPGLVKTRDSIVMDKIRDESKDTDISNFNVPINHFLHDLRALTLIEKLELLRQDKEVIDVVVDEVVIADLMLAINEKYPNDVDEHFALRNIVDL